MYSIICSALLVTLVNADDEASGLALDYQHFDQTLNAGWRGLAHDKKYGEAAALIEAYLARHAELDRFQKVNLHFHAAQVLAFDGDTEAALKHLASSRHEPEFKQSPVRWNDYVAATVAFLRRDREQLLAARERIAGGAAVDGEIPNLDVVDRLVKFFDHSYYEAYTAK